MRGSPDLELTRGLPCVYTKYGAEHGPGSAIMSIISASRKSPLFIFRRSRSISVLTTSKSGAGPTHARGAVIDLFRRFGVRTMLGVSPVAATQEARSQVQAWKE